MPPVPPAFCVANRVAVYSQHDGLQPGSDWPELCSANHRFSDWRIWLPRGATKMAGLPIASVAVRAVRAERYRHLGAGLLNNASLVEILIPFCVMAIANGAIYPIVVAQALRPFLKPRDALRRYKIRCSWGYVSWQAWWFHGSSARRC